MDKGAEGGILSTFFLLHSEEPKVISLTGKCHQCRQAEKVISAGNHFFCQWCLPTMATQARKGNLILDKYPGCCGPEAKS